MNITQSFVYESSKACEGSDSKSMFLQSIPEDRNQILLIKKKKQQQQQRTVVVAIAKQLTTFFAISRFIYLTFSNLFIVHNLLLFFLERGSPREEGSACCVGKKGEEGGPLCFSINKFVP